VRCSANPSRRPYGVALLALGEEQRQALAGMHLQPLRHIRFALPLLRDEVQRCSIDVWSAVEIVPPVR
jgi:hypothetical protein